MNPANPLTCPYCGNDARFCGCLNEQLKKYRTFREAQIDYWTARLQRLQAERAQKRKS